jgi:hypothetical protein
MEVTRRYPTVPGDSCFLIRGLAWKEEERLAAILEVAMFQTRCPAKELQTMENTTTGTSSSWKMENGCPIFPSRGALNTQIASLTAMSAASWFPRFIVATIAPTGTSTRPHRVNHSNVDAYTLRKLAYISSNARRSLTCSFRCRPCASWEHVATRQ